MVLTWTRAHIKKKSAYDSQAVCASRCKFVKALSEILQRKKEKKKKEKKGRKEVVTLHFGNNHVNMYITWQVWKAKRNLYLRDEVLTIPHWILWENRCLTPLSHIYMLAGIVVLWAMFYNSRLIQQNDSHAQELQRPSLGAVITCDIKWKHLIRGILVIMQQSTAIFFILIWNYEQTQTMNPQTPNKMQLNNTYQRFNIQEVVRHDKKRETQESDTNPKEQIRWCSSTFSHNLFPDFPWALIQMIIHCIRDQKQTIQNYYLHNHGSELIQASIGWVEIWCIKETG